MYLNTNYDNTRGLYLFNYRNAGCRDYYVQMKIEDNNDIQMRTDRKMVFLPLIKPSVITKRE